MFRAKTVFVIGAGASFEVGLPVGDNLLETIVGLTHFTFDFGRQTSGDPQILEALRILLNEGRDVTLLNQHLNAGRQLGQSARQAISIDNVIDALENPQIERLGKLGIARAILKAESDSQQFRVSPGKSGLELGKFKNTWYNSLTKLLCEGVRKSQISSIFNNLEIINFNYDRCLEHYLQHSISDYYGTGVVEVQTAMNNLTIHRPYGMIGRLPWRQGDGSGVNFGSDGARQLADVAQQIRTFTEQVEEGERLEAMRAAIANADRIVFLGFAFHRQNVSLISANIDDHTEVLATTLGISGSDQGVIQSELAEAFGYADDNLSLNRAEFATMSCNDFFKEYWRTLTAAPQEN
ncbi:hypothetical protein BH10PSE4_BH10PSE4_18460 [soil metagenome]